jgi:heptosyltransferase I
MPAREADRPHFCIVLLTGLGDVVNGLPLANAIRDAHPRARITWVAEPVPASMLSGHPSIDRIVTYRRRDGVRGLLPLWRDLRAGEKIDTTLNLNVYFKSAWPTVFSLAPRRIGFGRDRAFEGVWLFSSDRLPAVKRSHTADMFLEFARHLDIPVGEPEWRIRFTDSELTERARFFENLGSRPVVTIVPASASHKKDWLAERWAAVADSLDRDFGFQAMLAGGPGNREQTIGREIVRLSNAQIHWAMSDSVRRLAWLLSGSSLVIAPDTGPVHIARALNVPVIGLYGHTNPWRVGPWRAFHDLWVDNYTEPGEPPDASNRRPKWDRMSSITVEQVLAKVQLAADRYDVRTIRSTVQSLSEKAIDAQ